LLEDQAYRVLVADLVIGDDGRVGTALLALPAEGRGRRVAPAAAKPDALAQARDWSERLGAAVGVAEVRLEAVLARPRLPLSQVMALQAGMVLPLGAAALDSVAMVAPGGLCVATGRLGQNRGARALRLTTVKDEAAAGLPSPVASARPAAESTAPTAPEPVKLPQNIARSA
jgi:flagellar motor switch protein FliM